MALPINTEIDNVLKLSFKHLHSSNADSAEKIRLALDDLIKQRYGTSKMLINTLNKKIIQEEVVISEANKNNDQRDNVANTKACTSFYSSDAISIASEEENLTEFGDLACVLCGAMVVAAGNRLVECSECHSLYHQECHKPPIPDSAANADDCPWFCFNCKNKYISPNVCNKIVSGEAETVTESTQYIKPQEQLLPLFPAAIKTCSSEFTNNTNNKEDTSSQPITSNTTSTLSSTPTATINIVSSEKRLKLMKKTKHHDTKRKK